MIIDASGKLFGKINIFDLLFVVIALSVVLGVLMVQSGWHRTSGEMIKDETDIEYAVFLRHVITLRPEQLFKPGDTVSISIRNRPRGQVQVVSARYEPMKTVIPGAGGGLTPYQVIHDPNDPYNYDFLVTLKDHALITPDSYVTNGVKIKTGMTIVIEGFDFRIPGVVADIKRIPSVSPSSNP